MLYDKYKPQTLDDIIGQDIAVNILRNIALHYDKYKIHGMILSGPYGCGKTICSTLFSKLLNCNKLCNNCESCKNNTSSDIIILDGALNSGIDNIRQLIDRIQYSPLYLKYRVVILEEAHMLSKESMDVLLLTLQDPPLNTIFIFTTTNLMKITSTLRSRCLLVHINKIENDLLFKRIQQISHLENIPLNDQVLHTIANYSDNSLRQSISNLETIYLSNLTSMADVEKYLCIISINTTSNLFIHLMKGDIKGAVQIWNDIKSSYTEKALLLSFESLFHELRCWKNNLSYNLSEVIMRENIQNILTDSLLLHFFDILHHCLTMLNYGCKYIIITFFYMITHVEDEVMISSYIKNYNKTETFITTNFSELVF